MSIGYMKVTAKDNPSVKLYRKLAVNKRARMQEQSFVLEGYRIVSDAMKNSAQIKILFLPMKLLRDMERNYLHI